MTQTPSRLVDASFVSGSGPDIEYRFAYGNRRDQAVMPQYGYNLIDVATKSEADAVPAGTLAQVWLGNYDNTTCGWKVDDATISARVSSLADDPNVAGFYFAADPDPIKCANAIQQHKDRNALIKSLAPNKYTILGVDSNWRGHFPTQVALWKGVADYLVYNPYICNVGAACDFAWLDTVLQAAEANGNPYFVALQAFADGSRWRWPTADEEQQMLDRLKNPNLSLLRGYMTFSWNWKNDPLANHPDVLQVIKDFNLGTSTTPADTVAPTAPTTLTVTSATPTTISLSWGPSLDDVGVAGYDLFQDGNKIGTTSGTSYSVAGLSCGTSYTFAVDAYDAAGNRSQQASLVAASDPCADTVAPTAPADLTATASTTTSVSLSWGPSLDDVGVAGYELFQDGGKVGTTAGTTYSFAGLSCGTSYTLAVDAYDPAGNRSATVSVGGTTLACPAPPSDPVIVAAGDICSTATNCAPTALLIDTIVPTRVLALGDNAYQDGTSSEYASYYDPNWGRFKAKTSPTPGNHEYHTGGGAGYFAYFGSAAPAAYYSYDLGSWHLISLNGEIGIGADSAQETWLKNDLAAHPAKCTLAYWHEPRFSSGAVHGSYPKFDPFWRDLYAAGVDVVLNGHDHAYERFAPQNPSGVADPSGIREFVVGTGGASHYSFGTALANSEIRDRTSYGVLKLTLRPGSYDWQFVPIAGASFTDSGSGACH